MVVHMGRNKNDGIEFDSTVYLLEEKHRKFPVYLGVLQLLAVLIGGFCFISIFIHCLNLQFLDRILLVGLLVSGSVFFLLLLPSSYDFIKFIIVSVIYGGIIYYYFDKLKNGFYVLENAVIKQASSYYEFQAIRFVTEEATAIEDMTLLLIVILIPVLGLIALCLLRGKLTGVCYMVMLIPVIISFAMGITPPEIDMIAYILVFLFLYLSNGFIYKSSGVTQKSLIYRINIRSAFLVCMTALLLFSIIKIFVSEERYESNDRIKTAKTDIQEYMMDFSFRDDNIFDLNWEIGPSRQTGSGGLSYGELGQVDKVSFDQTEHLRVTMPLQSVIEGMYLKGYVGSVYTVDSWEIHSRNIRRNYEDVMKDVSLEGFEPAIGASFILGKEPYNLFTKEGRIEITYRNNNNRYVYAPYFTSFEDKVDFEYDLGAIPKGGKVAGSFDYRYDLANLFDYNIDIISYDDEFQEHFQQEKKYREFVYDTYTKLPEAGLERLTANFSRNYVGEPSENIWDAITYIKDYLKKNTRYTLSPGKLPKGKDFVEYFIYENKLGYCAHYASAGALMLRAMGYPARYVEGYAISRSDLMDSVYRYIDDFDIGEDIVEISVKDSNAHAWVEVYIDGFGWIPVEFTPASGVGDLVDEFAGNDQFGDTGNIEDDVDRPFISPPAPTDVPEEEVLPSQAPILEKEKEYETGPLGDTGDIQDSGLRWYWFVVPILIVALGILFIYLYFWEKRKGQEEDNHSKRALGLYKKAEKLFAFSKRLPRKLGSLEENEDYVKEYLGEVPAKDFENFMETVRKARFGKEIISLAEYLEVQEFYNCLEQVTYEESSQIKRLLLRLIL